jgi:hypothetical protein
VLSHLTFGKSDDAHVVLDHFFFGDELESPVDLPLLFLVRVPGEVPVRERAAGRRRGSGEVVVPSELSPEVPPVESGVTGEEADGIVGKPVMCCVMYAPMVSSVIPASE